MNHRAFGRFSKHVVCFIVLPLFPPACSDGNGNTTATGGNIVDPHADMPITANSVPLIQKGMTITQLREAVRDCTPWRYRFLDEDDKALEDWMKVARDLEPALEHQFTIARNGDIISCVAAQLFDDDPSLKIAFVFRNGTLEKLMPNPPCRWTQDRPGAMTLVTKPEARIDEILHTDSFTDETFITYVVENANERIESTRKHSEPLPPLAQALAKALIKPSARDLKVGFQNYEKFDGLKVSLGMSVDDVSDLFGDPKSTQESELGTKRIYGAMVGDVLWPFRPVLVEFIEDQARAVLSGPEFIDLEQYFGPALPEHRGKVRSK